MCKKDEVACFYWYKSTSYTNSSVDWALKGRYGGMRGWRETQECGRRGRERANVYNNY